MVCAHIPYIIRPKNTPPTFEYTVKPMKTSTKAPAHVYEVRIRKAIIKPCNVCFTTVSFERFHLHHLVEVQALSADDEREAADQLGDEAVLDKVRRFRLQEAVRLSTAAGNAHWVVFLADFVYNLHHATPSGLD